MVEVDVLKQDINLLGKCDDLFERYWVSWWLQKMQ